MHSPPNSAYVGLAQAEGSECSYNKRSTVRIRLAFLPASKDTVMPHGDGLVLGDQVVWGVRSEGRSRDARRQGGGRAQRPLLLGRDREVLVSLSVCCLCF